MSVPPAPRETWLLAVMSLTTLVFGLAYLVAPEAMAAQSGLAITRPAALAELRGYYGGLQVGMGVLFALGMKKTHWTPIALGAAAILFWGNGLGRLLGICLSGQIDTFNASAILFEFAFASLSSRSIWSRAASALSPRSTQNDA